jgi:hypothetical protein
MMKLFIVTLLFCFGFIACKNESKRPATAVETGREFIRATLDGRLDDAEKLLSKDSLNSRIFNSYKDFYKRLPADQKTGYKNAAYIINSFKDVNDSVSIINYSNDYMNKPMDIKVVKKNKEWNIDFAFTSGDTTITN